MTPLTTVSAPAALVIDSGASHHMCNDHTRFNSMKKLRQPIAIELGDDNKVTVSHHGLVNISQECEVNALYTPTFRLSLLSNNQLDTAGYTSIFGYGKCSISSPLTTITGNRVNDLYIISPSTALTSAVPSVSTKSTARTRKRDRASSSAHFTVSQWTPTTVFPKTTRKPLTISKSLLSHRRLAHTHPTALRSLLDGNT